MALERNKRLIKGIIGPRKFLNLIQFEGIMKSFRIPLNYINEIKKEIQTLNDQFDCQKLEEILILKANSNLKNDELSIIIKAAISNMKNVIVSPIKKKN